MTTSMYVYTHTIKRHMVSWVYRKVKPEFKEHILGEHFQMLASGTEKTMSLFSNSK